MVGGTRDLASYRWESQLHDIKRICEIRYREGLNGSAVGASSMCHPTERKPQEGTLADSTRRATISCPSCGKLSGVDLSKVSAKPKCGHCHTPLVLDRPVPVTDATLPRILKNTT